MLVLVGTGGVLGLVSPIAFVIASILAIVVFSYRQTLHAHPSGGGAYIVAKENLVAAPTYFFILSTLAMIGVRAWRVLTGSVQPVVPIDPVPSTRHRRKARAGFSSGTPKRYGKTSSWRRVSVRRSSG